MFVGLQARGVLEPPWPLLGVPGMPPQLLWLQKKSRKTLLAFWDETNTPLKFQVPLMGTGGLQNFTIKGASCFFLSFHRNTKIRGKLCLVPEELGKYRPERVVVL